MPRPHIAPPLVQVENEQLQSVNQQLQWKLDQLQKQLNKVVEENVRLHASSQTTLTSSQQRSPTTPTSPLPVIMEPATLAEEELEGELEGGPPTELYAQVDKTRVSGRAVWLGGRCGC